MPWISLTALVKNVRESVFYEPEKLNYEELDYVYRTIAARTELIVGLEKISDTHVKVDFKDGFTIAKANYEELLNEIEVKETGWIITTE